MHVCFLVFLLVFFAPGAQLECINLRVQLAGLPISGCYSPQPVGLGGDPDGLGRLQQQLAGLSAQQMRQTLLHSKRVQLE